MPLVDLGRLPAKATAGEPLPVARHRVPRGPRQARRRGRAGGARRHRRAARPDGADGDAPDRYVAWVTPDERGRLDLRGARLVRPAGHVGARRRAEDPRRCRRRADVHRGRVCCSTRWLPVPTSSTSARRTVGRRAPRRPPATRRDRSRRGSRPSSPPSWCACPGRPPGPPSWSRSRALTRCTPTGRGRCSAAGTSSSRGRRARRTTRRPATVVSGTFRTAAERLDAVAAMGFDVIYLPPIHPIGEVNRKGPNNTLDPGPDDPGSPWAIGSKDGGHDAIHPDLGTLDGLRRVRGEARASARSRGRPRPRPAVRARPPVGRPSTRSGSPPRPTAPSPTPRTRRRSTRTSTR